MTLRYRGVAYEPQSPSLPVVVQETEVKGSYRGAVNSIKQYEFQVSHREPLNWRTMCYLGRCYVVQAPPLVLASLSSM